MSTCISREGEYSTHQTEDGNFICDRCGVLDEEGIFSEIDALRAKVTSLTAAGDDLATALVLVLHDAHPVYGNTAGWRGGIGGAALTQSCSLLDPPPGDLWTQCDMPSEPAREWLGTHHPDFDLNAAKDRLRAKWNAALGYASVKP